MLLTVLAGGLFVVAFALLYGTTIAPSPRDGVQPVEFADEAFYAVLGRDLATTGIETTLSASGFSELPGFSAQTWYHWGELWLASAVITVLGTAPMAARYFVVLPVVLLAAAALTGTVVRRMAGTSSRWAYLFGFLACLLLAPVALIPGPFFSSWAVGMIFGITLYGLGAVAALLGLICLSVVGTRQATWGLATFVGSAAAFILPAHIVIALLALVGVATICAIRIVRSWMATRRLPNVSPVWRQALVATGVALLATVAWGMLTGHAMDSVAATSKTTSSAVGLTPFNASWRDAVGITLLGAGAMLAIPLAWLYASKTPLLADVYIGTMVLLLVGAIVWGARLDEFTMFYFFFAGVAVFAAPVAAVAVWNMWERLCGARRLRLAVVVVAVCAIQLDLGASHAMTRLLLFGPGRTEAIPVSLLAAISGLPAEAKLAYACRPFEESAFGNPQLISIDSHTGRRVVPMCFESDLLGPLIGAELSANVPALAFSLAPQLALYPDATTEPSGSAITAFLADHGIDYVYADAKHPNTLVRDAVPIASSGDGKVLRIR